MYTSAQLLELFNDLTGRPATDNAIPPAKKYTWLSRAQSEVVSEMVSIKPEVFYQKVGTSSMPTMSTVDHNVFTFGTGVVPFGKTQIYRALTDIPDRPMLPDYDYIDEVSQIRLLRNRTYGGTLYWRGVVMPAAISDSVNPALLPTDANELTAIRAAENFFEGGNGRNPQMADRMRKRWMRRFPYWCLVWKKQFDRGGALVSYSLRDILTP